MATTQTVKTTKTRTRRKKYGAGTGYVVCRNCGGDGRCKVRKKNKK